MAGIYDPELGERVAHFVQQDDGRLITGMVLLMNYIDEDGVACTTMTAMPDQSVTSTAGLLALGNAVSAYELTESVTNSQDHEGGTA